MYQAPSSIPNEFRPTYFVALGKAAMRAKEQALLCHVSQRDKDFMAYARIEGLARGWAFFHRMPDKHLEAFEVYKACWDR